MIQALTWDQALLLSSGWFVAGLLYAAMRVERGRHELREEELEQEVSVLDRAVARALRERDAARRGRSGAH